MPDTTLETRVDHLEQQVAALMQRLLTPVTGKSWRTTVGIFDGDALMREIDEEGRKIREADREQTAT
jgi:hypothetical protein